METYSQMVQRKKKVRYYPYSFFIHLKLFQNKNLKRYNTGLALIFVRLNK